MSSSTDNTVHHSLEFKNYGQKTNIQSILFFYLNIDLQIISCNKTFEKILRIPQSQIIGTYLKDIIGEEPYNSIESYLIKGLSGHELTFEVTFDSVHFNNRTASCFVVPRFDADHKVAGIYLNMEDITEKKIKEEQLIDNALRFRAIAYTGTDFIWEVNLKNDKLKWYVDDDIYRDFDPGKFPGSMVEYYKKIHPDDRKQVIRTTLQCMRSGKDFHIEARTLREESTYRDIEMYGKAIQFEDGRPTIYIGREKDITDRKRIQESLKENEERFRRIFEEGPYGIVLVLPSRKFFNANDRFCEISGYTKEELLELTIENLHYSDYSQDHLTSLNKLMSGEIKSFKHEFKLKKKDSTPRWVNLTFTLITDKKGKTLYLLGMFEDISQRKENEEIVQSYQNKLEEILEEKIANIKTVFQSVEEGVITVDLNMIITSLNEASKRIFCITDIIGKKYSDVAELQNDGSVGVLKKTLDTQETIRNFRIERKRADAADKVIELTCSPLINQHKQFLGAVLVARDITRINELERKLQDKHKYRDIIGKSAVMVDLFTSIDELSNTDTSVLITGETGTGKSLIAREIHHNSPRKENPLIEVNCSALAENLLESEMFGHVKGAFTGAIKDKIGRFQMADGGTILLDEIGDISLRIQLKLLTVLQEKKYERVGDSKTMTCDVRVIAATNKNVKELVKKGKFREDLYYRLKVIELRIPPLRERKEDIPVLIDHFCNDFNIVFKKNILGVNDETLHEIINYQWPGNIRELRHAIEHAFIKCRGSEIRLEHFPVEISHPAGKAVEQKAVIDDKEKETIIALKKTGWNKAKAARLLGISRTALYQRIKQYKLSDQEK